MAQVVFSFSGTTVINVTGGASAGTLGSATTRYILRGVNWNSGNTSKNQVFRIKDIRTGGTVFHARSKVSYDGFCVMFEKPLAVDGIQVTTMPVGLFALLYLDTGESA